MSRPHPLRFQIVSDLHLETPVSSPSYSHFALPIHAPNLFLLGDIGLTRHPQLFLFLTSLLTTHPSLRIFYVLGNHEPYGTTLDLSISQLEDYESHVQRTLGPKRFHFLNRTRVDIDENITILGCTLWTYIPPSTSLSCATLLTDFSEGKGIWERSIEQHNADHALDLRWLNTTISHLSRTSPERQIIVLTHHSPTADFRANNPRHARSSVKNGFRTDLSGEVCWTSEMVKMWGFGHTHYSCQFVDEGTGKLVVANQKGYGRADVKVVVVEAGEEWRVVVGEKEVVERGREAGKVATGSGGETTVVEEGAKGDADVLARTEPEQTKQRQSDMSEALGHVHVTIAPEKSKSSWRTATTKLKRALHIS